VEFSNGGKTYTLESLHNSKNDSDGYSGENQCVSLVKRYLEKVYNITGKAGDGGEVAKNLAEREPDKFELFENGSAMHPPAPGAVISMPYGKTGHVAVVKAVKIDGDTAYVQLIEQNVGSSKGGAVANRVAIFKKDKNGNWSGEAKTSRSGKYKEVYNWANPK